MSDYICRQAAIEAIQKHFNPENKEMEPQLAAVLAGGGVVLGHIPSAQPEIIACGDCKHWICHDRRCGYWNHVL